MKPATDESYTLAEGPIWDAPRRRLLWVDIASGTLFEGALDGERIQVTGRHQFDGSLGTVVPAADGTLLVATQEELVVLRPDGTREAGPRIIEVGEGRRLNDGATDPAGRFLVGTMLIDGPSENERLVRVEFDGSITVLDDDLTLSNGLAWSPDGQRMYSTDTFRRVVYVRNYDPTDGSVGGRRVHLDLGDDHPDGITIDVEEHLWVAIWGEGEVRRYAPDGTLVDRRSVPAPNVSSVAFAGDDLDRLVVTTATVALTEEQERDFPDSGHLFVVPVDVPGLPVTPWAP
ncbi:SMP-30/gluconolactonase/LRE family protein [Cryptosporangium sp. NPDC048952]|uniref:SMP-30/gluconolactonase/LRE family protein n=1 Tax=Cryptosporangium sp. NPDC048952 TaxID=3363961 RepID=UPI003719601D